MTATSSKRVIFLHREMYVTHFIKFVQIQFNTQQKTDNDFICYYFVDFVCISLYHLSAVVSIVELLMQE